MFKLLKRDAIGTQWVVSDVLLIAAIVINGRVFGNNHWGLVVILLAGTAADYIMNRSFYFPTPRDADSEPTP